jgi:hypothetical protein
MDTLTAGFIYGQINHVDVLTIFGHRPFVLKGTLIVSILSGWKIWGILAVLRAQQYCVKAIFPEDWVGHRATNGAGY